MKIYQVGGAVRDALLGLPVHDHDWVVVGATPEQMVAKGFLPVGKDFPVFLHPQTHEEYALARTERKTAPGYHGFAFYTDPTVTLEEDLARRDLTINAIAQDADGTLIDPYHGQQDLQGRVLRHVTHAFAEDPVRILRVARFAARYTDFHVAPETLALMQHMVAAGEVDALVAERVWQELSRGLLEKQPSRMLAVLRDCGALAKILPEIDQLFDTQQGMHIQTALDLGVKNNSTLGIQYTLLMNFPDHLQLIQQRIQTVEQISERLRVPVECRELALLAAKEKANIYGLSPQCGSHVYELFKRSDAFRQTQRFNQLLQAVQIDALAAVQNNATVPQPNKLKQTLDGVLKLDAKAIVNEAMKQGKQGKDVGMALEEARRAEVVRLWMHKDDGL